MQKYPSLYSLRLFFKPLTRFWKDHNEKPKYCFYSRLLHRNWQRWTFKGAVLHHIIVDNRLVDQSHTESHGNPFNRRNYETHGHTREQVRGSPKLLGSILLAPLMSVYKEQCYYSSFSNVIICCFSLSYMTVNGISLGFELLVRQNEAFGVVTLAYGKSWQALFYSLLMLCRPNNKLHSYNFNVTAITRVMLFAWA